MTGWFFFFLLLSLLPYLHLWRRFLWKFFFFFLPREPLLANQRKNKSAKHCSHLSSFPVGTRGSSDAEHLQFSRKLTSSSAEYQRLTYAYLPSRYFMRYEIMSSAVPSLPQFYPLASSFRYPSPDDVFPFPLPLSLPLSFFFSFSFLLFLCPRRGSPSLWRRTRAAERLGTGQALTRDSGGWDESGTYTFIKARMRRIVAIKTKPKAESESESEAFISSIRSHFSKLKTEVTWEWSGMA